MVSLVNAECLYTPSERWTSPQGNSNDPYRAQVMESIHSHTIAQKHTKSKLFHTQVLLMVNSASSNVHHT